MQSVDDQVQWRSVPLKVVSSRTGDPGSPAERMARGGGFRLMVIDPRTLTRDCLVAALEATQAYRQIIAVSSMNAAVEKLKSIPAPDVVVLNLAGDPLGNEGLMPLTAAIRSVAPGSGIVILASEVDKARAAMAFRLGVRGFLNSDTPFDVATEAIRFVARGWMIYPAFDFSDGPHLLGDAPQEAIQGLQFTARQRQVLDGLEHGLTNSKIAAAMNVSERTIKAHVKEIMRRIGATNRTQVVVHMARLRRLGAEQNGA